MASLDWYVCPAVESVPGKVSGAWVFQGHPDARVRSVREPGSGATVDEIMEWFHLTKEQVVAVLEFAGKALTLHSPLRLRRRP